MIVKIILRIIPTVLYVLCRKTKPIIIDKRIRITINTCKKNIPVRGNENTSSVEHAKKKIRIKNSGILRTEKRGPSRKIKNTEIKKGSKRDNAK
ncbi:MAG: hypothetical protein LBI06_08805 [Treponema sp.]|jgi:hypothetical protein|nr:hypothetical protein [Treponema sp.]